MKDRHRSLSAFIDLSARTKEFLSELVSPNSLAGEPYVSGASTTSAISGNNNLFFGNGAAPSYFAGSIAADPKFASAATGNFHLLSGNPAIDAGVTMASLATNHDGVARPQGATYDLGAYEFFTGSSRPNPPTNLTAVMQ